MAMSNASMFCCLRGCLNGFGMTTMNAQPAQNSNPIHLDTCFMGYEVVIIKGGTRVCGAGAVLGSAPVVQTKAYFEVKVQLGGTWSVGLATRQTDLNATRGGMDPYSWTLCSDCMIRHDGKELSKVSGPGLPACDHLQEGDIIGIAFDHVQMRFFINGIEVEYAISNCIKGTVYPVLYVDDGSILDIILDNFNYPPPPGFDKIMLEQSLL